MNSPRVPLEFRSVDVVREAVDKDKRTVELAFASDTPVVRWWGKEILEMSTTSVRLGRLTGGRHPLLVEHDTHQQVGVIERAWIGDDRVARCIVRFGNSARAEEIFQDVIDGIRSLVSVGYQIHKVVLVESNKDTGEDTWRITDWEPFEVSIVAIPADPSVGVAREADRLLIRSFLDQSRPERVMSKENTPAAPAAATVDVAEVQNQVRTNEVARIREIRAMGDSYDLSDEADKCIEDGTSVADFQKRVMKKLKDEAPKKATERNLGLTDKEIKNYSISRAVLAAVDPETGRKLAGFEMECHREAVKRFGDPKNNGIFVPHDVLQRQMVAVDAHKMRRDPMALATLHALQAQRDLTTTPVSAGGALVATQNLASSFIELLRARARVVQLGAVVLPGLRDNVLIPRQSGAATFNWLATEATQIAESQQTFGQLSLTPKNGGAYTEISRQLMLQSSPAADMIVMSDLSKVCALGVDLAALAGSGAAGQPTGVINTAGIGAVTGTSLAWAGVVEFETDVATANADVDTMHYLTTPAVRGLLKTREKAATTGNFIWGGVDGDSQVNGYPGHVSTQVPAANMLFGDFSQIVIGEWGTLEIASNPYANFQAGIVGIRAFVTVDIGVRQPTAFSLATGIT